MQMLFPILMAENWKIFKVFSSNFGKIEWIFAFASETPLKK
jgi:hypothetical protein